MACEGHSNLIGTCITHTNSCGAFYGYVSSRTITFINGDVQEGEVIDLEDEIHELLQELNNEATRRSPIVGSPTPIGNILTQPIQSSQIRSVRDLFIDLLDISAQSPYSDVEIAPTIVIENETIESMKDGIISDSSICVCDCNYSCTCECNYSCTCVCNYCACDCNYCTCNCNHACQCNCAYGGSCSCDCAFTEGGNKW